MIAASDTKNAAATAIDACPKSKEVWVWFRRCFLRYSNHSFFGVLDQTAAFIMNNTYYEDSSVVFKGLDFVRGLASTVPKQSLTLQTAVLDVDKSGKRYVMAQCNRDISRSDCAKCLNNQLVGFKDEIRNRSGWEIYATSCFMWYQDYQFYFNISTAASKG